MEEIALQLLLVIIGFMNRCMQELLSPEEDDTCHPSDNSESNRTLHEYISNILSKCKPLTFALSFHTKVPFSIVAIQTSTQIPAIIAMTAQVRKNTGSCQIYMRGRVGMMLPFFLFVGPLISMRIRRGALR
jgi:hypothetical protein